MEYEWDSNKAVATIEKHAIDFVDAVEVFADGRLFVKLSAGIPSPAIER